MVFSPYVWIRVRVEYGLALIASHFGLEQGGETMSPCDSFEGMYPTNIVEWLVAGLAFVSVLYLAGGGVAWLHLKFIKWLDGR